MDWIVTVSTGLLCLYVAWTIGANDVANSMGAAVGSRAITIKQAVIVAGICEFAGAVLVGTDVTDTVRKGIVDPNTLAAVPEVLCLGMACVLLAAALWLHLASWVGMPVSTTHSVVGGVAGFGVVAAGWGSVYWGKMGQIVLSWLISPLSGLVLGFLMFRFIIRFVLGQSKPMAAAVRMTPLIAFLVAVIVALGTIYKGLRNLIVQGRVYMTGGRAFLIAAGVGIIVALIARILVRRSVKDSDELSLADQLHKVEGVFIPLALISSCSVAFAHGANDVANAVGPLAAIVDIIKTGSVEMSVHVPFLILALGGAGIALGLATYGYRVMRTIGSKITELTPSRAVAVNIATATTVLVCTRLKLPVSTSHTVVGAVVGIGIARGLGAVNKQVARRIFGSWLLTVPAVAAIAVVLFLLGQLVGVDAFVGQVIHPAPGGGAH